MTYFIGTLAYLFGFNFILICFCVGAIITAKFKNKLSTSWCLLIIGFVIQLIAVIGNIKKQIANNESDLVFKSPEIYSLILITAITSIVIALLSKKKNKWNRSNGGKDNDDMPILKD